MNFTVNFIYKREREKERQRQNVALISSIL